MCRLVLTFIIVAMFKCVGLCFHIKQFPVIFSALEIYAFVFTCDIPSGVLLGCFYLCVNLCVVYGIYVLYVVCYMVFRQAPWYVLLGCFYRNLILRPRPPARAPTYPADITIFGNRPVFAFIIQAGTLPCSVDT